jgi:hypothetical protein
LIGCNIGTIDWKGLQKYAVEKGSGAMIYIPSFIKIGSAIQKLLGGNTYRHAVSKVSSQAYFYFYKISKTRKETHAQMEC